MAVHIRMSRHGAKKTPFYRIVVADQRSPRDGRFIEPLGTFDPSLADKPLVVNQERLAYWKSQGAQLSHTLVRLLKQHATPAAG